MPVSACIALIVLAIAQIAAPAAVNLPDEILVLPRRTPVLQPQTLIADGDQAAGALFAPDRASAAAAGDGSGLSLAGVARASGYGAALIRRSDGTATLLRVGQSVEGWRLAGIGADAVLLTRGPDRQRLTVTASAATPAQGAGATGDDEINEDE